MLSCDLTLNDFIRGLAVRHSRSTGNVYKRFEQPSCCGEGRAGFQRQGRPGCACTSAEVVLCCRTEASRIPSVIRSLLEYTNFLLGSKNEIWPELSDINWDWAPFPAARAVGVGIRPRRLLSSWRIPLSRFFVRVFVSCSSVFPV